MDLGQSLSPEYICCVSVCTRASDKFVWTKSKSRTQGHTDSIEGVLLPIFVNALRAIAFFWTTEPYTPVPVPVEQRAKHEERTPVSILLGPYEQNLKG